MAILTVDDYINAAGGPSLSDGQAAQIQYYIDIVSAYLESLTGSTFSAIVGDLHRVRSDGLGEITLLFDPISDVTNVYDWDTGLEVFTWYWDGFYNIKGLHRFKTYVVKLNYGYDPTPADIKGVATEAVKRGYASNPTGLKMKTVGDVSYQYGDMLDFSGTNDQAVLANYTESNQTWSLATPRNNETYARGFRYNDWGFILNEGDYDIVWDDGFEL